MKASVDKRWPISWMHRIFKISRRQKQGFVWFLPWWHVLIRFIKIPLLSAISASNLPPFLLGLRVVPNVPEHLRQNLKHFPTEKQQSFYLSSSSASEHPGVPSGNGPVVREGLMCQRTFQLVRHRIQPASLPGLTPCGCEEEHPPLHKRRCLDLVLTSFNCQSMSNRAFQLLCESKCNAFWLPWNSRQQASLRDSQSFSPPALAKLPTVFVFCLSASGSQGGWVWLGFTLQLV